MSNEELNEVLDEETTETVEETVEETPKTEIELLQEELDEKNDSFLRLTAEYTNFRNRSMKEKLESYNNATAKAVEALLPVYDTLTLAIGGTDSSDDSPHKKGLELTLKQLEDSFKSLNIEEIDSTRGVDFDANVHNAVMQIDDAELESGKIANTFQKGFKIGDKVIRYSTVQVAN